jgi:hypothetical protein
VQTTDDARVALLSRLIDHAPLFPPASLPPVAAVAEDRRARESEHAFALARFVCPVSLLGELSDSGRALSVVLDAPFDTDARAEAVEARWRDELDSLTQAPEVYVEVPLDEELEARLDLLAESGLRAKVRCGGSSVPASAELARFVRGCVGRGLGFKATAGLHHAVRSDGEHGLLNLLAAAVFGDEETVLGETDGRAFRLDRESFAWRDQAAGPVELVRVREERLRSIGSCSFFEPMAELEALGILPL